MYASIATPIMERLRNSFATPAAASAVLGITVLGGISIEPTNVAYDFADYDYDSSIPEDMHDEDLPPRRNSAQVLRLLPAAVMVVFFVVVVIVYYQCRHRMRESGDTRRTSVQRRDGLEFGLGQRRGGSQTTAAPDPTDAMASMSAGGRRPESSRSHLQQGVATGDVPKPNTDEAEPPPAYASVVTLLTVPLPESWFSAPS